MLFNLINKHRKSIISCQILDTNTCETWYIWMSGIKMFIYSKEILQSMNNVLNRKWKTTDIARFETALNRVNRLWIKCIGSISIPDLSSDSLPIQVITQFIFFFQLGRGQIARSVSGRFWFPVKVLGKTKNAQILN